MTTTLKASNQKQFTYSRSGKKDAITAPMSHCHTAPFSSNYLTDFPPLNKNTLERAEQNQSTLQQTLAQHEETINKLTQHISTLSKIIFSLLEKIQPVQSANNIQRMRDVAKIMEQHGNDIIGYQHAIEQASKHLQPPPSAKNAPTACIRQFHTLPQFANTTQPIEYTSV